MKKNMMYAAALAMGLAFAATSCSNSDEPQAVNPADLEYSAQNANSWHNYMGVVAKLLEEDSNTLYSDWSEDYNASGRSYAEIFKAHDGDGYTSAISCIEQILDGCWDIANEVGGAKIGDPYNLYKAGKTTEALYAVESWYSWHSREDYSNNIISIQNAYYGTRNMGTGIDNGTIHANSIAALVKANNAALHQKVDAAIKAAWTAILNIPAPFRNNIGSAETVEAMEACAALAGVLRDDSENLKSYLSTNFGAQDAVLSPIVSQYVDALVLPTYKDLKEKNAALRQSIETLASNRTDENFKAACEAWLVAREPWEESEAFLFGPVANKGLDPNMDSWPLDQEAIVNILNSGKFDDLDWSGDYSEDDQGIADKQSVRGFHTLEFLLFKDGKARSVN